MKRIMISFVLCSMLLLVSCQGKQNNGSVTKVDRSDTLVWALPSDSLKRRSAKLWEKNVSQANRLLAEKGYHLAIELCYLEMDDEKQEVYHNALAEAVKKEEVDIAYCDLWYDTAPGEMSQYLQSDLFYPLTEWLHSPDGAPVYDLYDEDTWKGCSVGGTNYILPNEDSYIALVSDVAFQQDHVSEQMVDSWDGSWGDLWQLMQQIKLQEKDYMILGDPWLHFFEGTVQKKRYEVNIDRLVYDIQEGKVKQPFELEVFHEYLSFLHQCFQKGYFTEDCGMDSFAWDKQKEKALEEGRYAIAFGVGSSKDRQLESAVAFTGALGGGTAVSAYSKKKEKAMELLKILRTDDEIANALVWGEWEASKILGEDGYVKESYGDGIARDVFGLNDGIFQKEEEGYPAQDMREYRKDCEASPLRISSVLLGFWPDYTGMEEELAEYKEVLAQCLDCWQEEDFKGAYQAASKKVSEASKPLLKELNRQIEEWKKNEG